jgi:hypothetical protein
VIRVCRRRREVVNALAEAIPWPHGTASTAEGRVPTAAATIQREMEFREEQKTFPSATWERGDAWENPLVLACAAARIVDMPLREKAVWGNFIIHVFVGIFLFF